MILVHSNITRIIGSHVSPIDLTCLSTRPFFANAHLQCRSNVSCVLRNDVIYEERALSHPELIILDCFPSHARIPQFRYHIAVGFSSLSYVTICKKLLARFSLTPPAYLIIIMGVKSCFSVGIRMQTRFDDKNVSSCHVSTGIKVPGNDDPSRVLRW